MCRMNVSMKRTKMGNSIQVKASDVGENTQRRLTGIANFLMKYQQ